MDLESAVRLTPPLGELTFRGELDLSTTESVRCVVDQAVASGCSLVTLDLEDVTFIDCSGVRALVEAHQRLNDRACHLWLIGFSPQVSRMLRLTGADGLLGVGDVVPR